MTSAPQRVVPSDPIFFGKAQLRLGTRLINVGRTSQNELWEVDHIHTVYPDGHEGYLKTPRTLRDYIILRQEGSLERRWIRFGTLSYSAIWRII